MSTTDNTPSPLPFVPIRHMTLTPYKGRGKYQIVQVRAPHHNVEVTVSPTGRTIQVHVNGERVA
jgi:uncharacterized protein (DUF427 family)